jgi:flavin-dependent dehydrogenase
MIKKCDLLVVGAGTAGTYLSWIIAKKGYSVILIEKDKREEVGFIIKKYEKIIKRK